MDAVFNEEATDTLYFLKKKMGKCEQEVGSSPAYPPTTHFLFSEKLKGNEIQSFLW